MMNVLFETFIVSNDKGLSNRLLSLTDSIPQEHRHVVASCYELRQTLAHDTPSIIICDLRNLSRSDISELSHVCTGKCMYNCICICSEGQVGFRSANSRRLSDGFDSLEFQLAYFGEVQKLIDITSGVMFGHIRRERIEKYVSETLCRLGIAKCNRGHDYLTCAVTDVIFDPSAGTMITKVLLHGVSRRMSASVAAVEHAIRYQITGAYTGGYKMVIDNIFRARKYRNNVPTTCEFVPWLADIIRTELKRINRIYDAETKWTPETDFRFDKAIGGDTYKDETLEF